MEKPPSNISTRNLARMGSALIDLVIGVGLILGGYDLLPFRLVIPGLSPGMSGMIGFGLAVIGIVVMIVTLANHYAQGNQL